MDTMFQTLIDPAFQGAMFNLSIVAMVMALGLLVVSFAYYGRARETMPQDKAEARWALLFATWRDSLIITLLFAAESFSFDMQNFQGLSQIVPNSLFFYAPIVQPLVSFVVHVLIFVVAALRIVAISRWLTRT